MKTVVLGEKIKNTYEVKPMMDENGNFTLKPHIVLVDKYIKYEEICSYEGTPQSKESFMCHEVVYLSEDERVTVKDEKFRADQGVWYQYTDKVLESKDVNLKKCEKELKSALEVYNAQKIADNPKAKAYCELHKLNPAETDYDQLMEIIGKDNTFEITSDGIRLNNPTCFDLSKKEFEELHNQVAKLIDSMKF